MTMNKMTLESLSNELFTDLFELFNAVELFRCFHGLNIRFNSLLFIHFRTYRVDFRSIFKEDFNVFYRTYLPSIINRIIYLRLSDDDDTPYQCTHLLSAGFSLGRFDNLRSLTFSNVSSDPKINQFFFSDLYQLRHLTHLKFIDCRLFHVNTDDFQGVIDRIWSLPKLAYCYWELKFHGETDFCIPTSISTSLQYLTILGSNWSSYQFADLLDKTPRLRNFSISLDSYEEDDLPPPFPEFKPTSRNLSVKKLVLTEVSSQRVMINLLQLLPNITHLKVETSNIKLDGHQWKQIIINYLPHLKVLQFSMSLNYPRSIYDQNNEQKVDQYLDTYRTPFWIEHHQWFVRCHWRLWLEYLSIRVYTLPYKFYFFPIYYNELNTNTKSTCPHEMHFSYDTVRNVAYDPSVFNDDALSHVQLIDIEVLSLQLPIDHRFLLIIPKLENLRWFNLTIPTNNYQSQLQTLLDSAPRLYSLKFDLWKTSSMPPYQYTSSSIHRLDLHGFDKSRREHYYYDRTQCMELCKSPLGIQCRVLIIEVKHPGSIIKLIKSMINLRTLNVSYKYDRRGNKYDLVQLLQNILPSTWTVTRFCYGRIIIQS
jgi:hypothetical protein